MILLSTEDTRGLITMAEAIDVLEDAYRELGRAEGVYRPRSDMVVPMAEARDYWLSTMEGALRGAGVAAIRLRSDIYAESERDGTRIASKWAGRPGLFCGLVVLYDMQTAVPLAIINDGHLQVMRVAATSAVAARHLARADSRRLGVVGSGWQARDHARAYACLFPVERIRVFSRTPEHREAFAAEMGAELGIPVDVADDARTAVEGSDIVAVCTTAQKPVVDLRWLAPGTYVSSIRYYSEIDHGAADRVDVHAVHPLEYGWTSHRAGTPAEWARATEGGDLYKGDRLPPGAVPLQDLVAGRAAGRTRPEQITLFNNHAGMGIQFAALGALVHRRAVERGVGRQLPAEWFLQDVTT